MRLPRERWSPLHGLALACFALALSVLAWWPMIAAYPATQGGDGPPYQKTLEAALVSVTRYHELPLWNPYECGGLPLWDNPQGPAGALLVWPMLAIGTTWTMILWYVVHSAAGFVCMWIFLREELECSLSARLVGSAMWAFCGFHQQHYGGGHLTFVPFLYFPLAILLWRRSASDDRIAVAFGALLAWMFYEGAVYPLPHLVVVLACESLLRVVARPRASLPMLRAGAIVGVVAFGLAASRLLPVVDQLRAHKRPLADEQDHIQWRTFQMLFVSRTQERGVVGQEYVWPEYGSYVGPVLLALSVLGIAIAGLEYWWLLVLLGLSVALMLGHFAPYAPWHILKGHVFPFKQMRVPSRFRAEVSLFLAAFAALAVDRLPRLLQPLTDRWPGWRGALQAGLLALAMVGVGDMMGVGTDWFAKAFYNPPLTAVEASPRLYVDGPGLTSNMVDQPRQNRARAQCWDEWGWSQGAAFWQGDVPQARAASEGAVVRDVRRTQNTFVIDVSVERPTRLLLNTTFDVGFRSTVGSVANEGQLLALDVPPGEHHLVVRYWPRLLTAGLVITAVSVPLTAAFLIWDARRRRALAA